MHRFEIVSDPIHADWPRMQPNFIFMIFYDSIPYIRAHGDHFCTIYWQTETTKRTARKLSANLVEKTSNLQLVRRVVEITNGKRRLGAVPKRYELIRVLLLCSTLTLNPRLSLRVCQSVCSKTLNHIWTKLSHCRTTSVTRTLAAN